ncbi:unnamed protein product [Coccothraustes coccothraustes]
MLALREAEHTNLKLPEAKRRSRAAFGRSRALESSATGTMLSARRSRFFASRSRTGFSLRERVEKLAVNMLALREAEHTNLKLPEAKRRSRAAFSRSRPLESTATGTMLSARRSRFFASGSRTAGPLLRRYERSRT